MRLLQLSENGEFSLTDDIIVDIPRYAILSHTWGRDGEEVTFKDLQTGSGKTKPGYHKLQFCGEQAARDGLEYFWVDTCCIDKSSSAELQEAINSMFNWYRDADRCYVYLADVLTKSSGQADPPLQSWLTAFRKSRWFTRGWTLQELVAPRSVEFFSSNGERLGDKESLEGEIHEITGISVPALRGSPLSEFSVAERMSWSKTRETTREEDRAYCLLGIFNIHMPLIYSEGADHAFGRLKEEILKRQQKRHIDELSSLSEDAPNPNKRVKTPRNELSSDIARRESKTFDEVPLLALEYSVPNLEAQDELPTNISEMIDAEMQRALISRLSFSRIDERLITLTAAQGTTCRWFLNSPEYVSWKDRLQQRDHGGFLWIKGNPGTGKSTMMKFLFEEESLNTKSDLTHLTISFFFVARGTTEEKTTSGLYRSLLHQLFRKAEELKESLEWLTTDGATLVTKNGWTEEALKRTLLEAIRKLGSKSLTIYVDALDECERSQAVGMICFFEELCDQAREAHVCLKICLSSRHYPTVVIQRGIEVTLENETGHTEDIEQYTKSKLRLGKLKQAGIIQSEILQRSSGVFLWVVLVIDILNSEYLNKLISVKQILERLKEIPLKLSDLFEMILAQDGDDPKRLKLCLQWILFAVYPLQPQELYFAIQFGLDENCSGYWDQEDVGLLQMEAFVSSSSKGLAQITREKSDVQFIHESVRDFLMGKSWEQLPGISSNFVCDSHEVLKNCCLAQLKVPIPGLSIRKRHLSYMDVEVVRKTPRKEFPFLQYSVVEFPFLQYSVHALHHSNIAQQMGVEQGTFLAEFPIQRWILISNSLTTNHYSEYTKSASLLYILAQENFDSLIRIHPQKERCFDVGNEQRGPPIFAARANASNGAIKAFLEAQAELHPDQPLLRSLCDQFPEDAIEPIYYDRDFNFCPGQNISGHVAGHGDVTLFKCLCALGKFDLESRDNLLQTPLIRAVWKGSAIMVNLLLERGADLEARDKFGSTPLFIATTKEDRQIMQLLFKNGADIESRSNDGSTPLIWAIRIENKMLVEFLLKNGADIESRNNASSTPLIWAVRTRNKMLVEFLLESGADIESRDDAGSTPLELAVRMENKTLVEFLLESGADIESRNNAGSTLLELAVRTRNKMLVEFLLESGADIESRDDAGLTPLIWAIRMENKTLVEFLLESGADIESRDDTGRTPVLWASETWHEGVQLLLDKGADSEVRDNAGSKLVMPV